MGLLSWAKLCLKVRWDNIQPQDRQSARINDDDSTARVHLHLLRRVVFRITQLSLVFKLLLKQAILLSVSFRSAFPSTTNLTRIQTTIDNRILFFS